MKNIYTVLLALMIFLVAVVIAVLTNDPSPYKDEIAKKNDTATVLPNKSSGPEAIPPVLDSDAQRIVGKPTYDELNKSIRDDAGNLGANNPITDPNITYELSPKEKQQRALADALNSQNANQNGQVPPVNHEPIGETTTKPQQSTAKKNELPTLQDALIVAQDKRNEARKAYYAKKERNERQARNNANNQRRQDVRHGPVARGDWIVQAGAYQDPAKAEKVRQMLQRRNVFAEVKPVNSNGKRLYRVRTGKMSERDARRIGNDLQRNGVPTIVSR